MENKKKSFWDKIDKEMLGYNLLIIVSGLGSLAGLLFLFFRK